MASKGGDIPSGPRPLCTCGRDFDGLVRKFRRTNSAVAVDFRALTKCFPYGERVTHSIHPYPAKLLPQIPHLLLSQEELCPSNSVLADPFCGSGTVLLEAALAGHQAVGIDRNPLARLIARVKTNPLDPDRLLAATERLEARVLVTPDCPPPPVVNLEYWYKPRIIRELSRIHYAIRKTRASDVREFFEVAFSVAVRKLSLADPRVPVPVRQNVARYAKDHWLYELSTKRLARLEHVNVLNDFVSTVKRNIERMRTLWAQRETFSQVDVRIGDVRDLAPPDGRIRRTRCFDLILTSPPYASAQKYVRSSSLSLGWLGMCAPSELSQLERELIGREHFRQSEVSELPQTELSSVDRLLRRCYSTNPHRAVAIASYLIEMRAALTAVSSRICRGGHLILVVGDNEVMGRHFPTSRHLQDIMEDLGFRTKVVLRDAIRSRGLLTKRNSTAGIIAHEYVIVTEKV